MSITSELNKSNKVAAGMTKSMEKALVAKYRVANKELKVMFGDLYSKYGIKDKLTYAEMQKYNRLKLAQKEITKTMNVLYLDEKRILTSGLSEMYRSGYYRTGFAIEKELQAKLSYKILDVERIRAAIQNPISGLTLNQTLLKNKAQVISKINQSITQGLMRGEGYGKMAKRITKVLGGDAKKSIVVAQTEAHRVHNQASLESMEHANDLGVKTKKIWVSTLDGETRDAHQMLDGQEADKNGNFHSENGGSGQAPGSLGEAADDINCRCNFIIELAGVTNDFRRARGEGIIPYKNYTEWSKANGLKKAG